MSKRTRHTTTPSATYGAEASDHRLPFSGHGAKPCLHSQDPYTLLEWDSRFRHSPQVLVLAAPQPASRRRRKPSLPPTAQPLPLIRSSGLAIMYLIATTSLHDPFDALSTSAAHDDECAISCIWPLNQTFSTCSTTNSNCLLPVGDFLESEEARCRYYG